jgi:hypothetical protein
MNFLKTKIRRKEKKNPSKGATNEIEIGIQLISIFFSFLLLFFVNKFHFYKISKNKRVLLTSVLRTMIKEY